MEYERIKKSQFNKPSPKVHNFIMQIKIIMCR